MGIKLIVLVWYNTLVWQFGIQILKQVVHTHLLLGCSPYPRVWRSFGLVISETSQTHFLFLSLFFLIQVFSILTHLSGPFSLISLSLPLFYLLTFSLFQLPLFYSLPTFSPLLCLLLFFLPFPLFYFLVPHSLSSLLSSPIFSLLTFSLISLSLFYSLIPLSFFPSLSSHSLSPLFLQFLLSPLTFSLFIFYPHFLSHLIFSAPTLSFSSLFFNETSLVQG